MNLFVEGGLLYMSLLTLIAIVGVFFAIKKNYELSDSIGIFSLVFGVLANLISLYGAFTIIQAAGDVAPTILYGGIRLSMIPMLYGLLIFLFLKAWSIVAKSRKISA